MSQRILKKVQESSIYPQMKQFTFTDYENALCDFKVSLPIQVRDQILDFTKDVTPKFLSNKSRNDSVLNCYDFHYSDSKLKLIEVNTNASGFLITNILEEEALALKYEEDILNAFVESFGEKPKKVYINDEDPDLEKMKVEFFMYQDFFKRNGIEAEIIKTKELSTIIEESKGKVFCYNRDCDFYLDDNKNLKKYWQEGKLILSAHPEAYEMLASKKVLLDLKIDSDLFLKNYLLTKENQEELWANKKSFFFKPLESYGSKGVYAGKSVSKKKFQDILEIGNYMAQEIHLPGKVKEEGIEWKYDIRAFFSKTRVHKIVCRVYKGQVTNFKEPGGGFALIDWID